MSADNNGATIRKASVAYNFFILIVTGYSLLIVLFIQFGKLPDDTQTSLLGIDLLVCLVFLVDFGRRFLQAPSKRKYMLSTGWLELIGSLPGLPLLRFARLARLVSVFEVLRQKSVSEMLSELRKDRAGAAYVFVVLFGTIAMSLISVLVLAFEQSAPGANIDNFSNALWWTIVTTATVGYGDYYPVTIYGRILSVLLMTFGIGLFGLLASSLATWFLSPRTQDLAQADKADIQRLQGQLQELQSEIARLHARLDENLEHRPPE